MKNFGKNLRIKRKQPSPLLTQQNEMSEKEIFIDLIDVFDECNKRTDELEERYMMGISDYDEPFYMMMENLILLHYGGWKTEIILWWIYDRIGVDGSVMPLEVDVQSKEFVENVILETSEQLWDIIEKIDKIEKNKL